MTNRIPDYLRLITEAEECLPVVAAPEQNVFNIDVLCQKFSEVTGVDLQYGKPNSLAKELDWFMEVEEARPGETSVFGIKTPGKQRSSKKLRQIENLAGEVGWLVNKLHQSERALWEREGELAVGIPVTARPETECEQIAARLEAVLRCGVESVGCTAGALYILDESTTELKLRSQWGFEDNCFTEPGRALRGARADLEALTGHAIVVESRDELNYWDLPDGFSAAVCVPVSTMNMPLGTLWIYSTDERPFNDSETNLIEIVAGRIATELEREVLVRDAANRRKEDSLSNAVAWQQRMVPAQPPLADGWDFAAATSYANSLNGDHCFWHSRGDGHVLATVSSVVGDVPEIALTSSLVAGTVRGLCESRLASDVVQGVNRTLWSSSDGDLLASIFVGEFDPRTGKAKINATGDIGMFLIRPHGWEEIASCEGYCGSNEELDFDMIEQRLEADDILLVMSSPRNLSPRLVANNSEMQHMAELALLHTHISSSELIKLLRAEWEPRGPLDQSPPAMMVIKRNQ